MEINYATKAADSLVQLINDYIACSNYCCKLLKDQFKGNDTLLGAKNSKLITKQGLVDGMNYYFHGRGCLFEFENDAIEVDFGPEGRWDGFDLYRLSFFLEKRQLKYQDLTDKTKIELAFNLLIQRGVIMKHPSMPEDHLYYLSKDIIY